MQEDFIKNKFFLGLTDEPKSPTKKQNALFSYSGFI